MFDSKGYNKFFFWCWQNFGRQIVKPDVQTEIGELSIHIYGNYLYLFLNIKDIYYYLRFLINIYKEVFSLKILNKQRSFPH